MPWDQVRDLLACQDRLDSLLAGAPQGWTPPADVYETADAFVILLELAGLVREDVQIEAQADRITLSGTRQPPAGTPGRYHTMERGHGRFARVFAFPEPIDVEGIAADFHDGLLTVTIPKRERPAPRRIAVT